MYLGATGGIEKSSINFQLEMCCANPTLCLSYTAKNGNGVQVERTMDLV